MKNKTLLMIPGPTPVVRSIQDEMGRDTVAFGDANFVKDYKGVIEDLKDLFGAKESFVIAGTGTLAMEMGLANISKEGEKVLLLENGFFGKRYLDICERKKLDVKALKVDWGDTVKPEDLEKELEANDYDIVIATHVDTSTGVVAPIEEYGEIIKDKALFIVDGVCATAGVKENLEKMNIDMLITGSQKAFGVAPGLAIVMASEKAMAKRESLGEIRDYYIDFKLWKPIMDDPSKYFATPPVNLIWALKESIRIIKEEGLEERYLRHEKEAKAFQKGLEALGFEILAKPEYRAATLSNVLYMDGIDDGEFRKTLLEEGAVVAGGLGDYAGKMFRIGHMGNADLHTLTSAMSAIERTLERLGQKDKMGLGVKTYLENR